MLRKFSDELVEDREFEIGGETFRFRVMHWTEAATVMDGEDVKDAPQAGDDGVISFRADTEYAIANMNKYLDPENDAVKRWKALCARKTDPVPRHQIVQAFVWARERALGIPTVPPSELSTGGGSNGTSSSAESLSPEATPTA